MLSRLVILVFLIAISIARAQTPATIIVLKIRDYEQTSPTEQRLRSSDFGIYIDFSARPPVGTRVQFAGPAGVNVLLNRNDDGSYEYTQSFASDAALEVRFPDGAYTVSVNGGTTASTSVFTVSTGAVVPPVLITNFAGLQSLTGETAVIAWDRIAGASFNDFVAVTIELPDGRSIDAGNLSGTAGFASVGGLPRGVALTGSLTYAQLTAAQINGGATNVGTGRGFNVGFPLFSPLPVPVILAQPLAQELLPGGFARIEVEASNASSYQWRKDGVPIPGATGRTLEFTPLRRADAGRYSVDVTNSFGTIPSNAARLAILPALNMTTFAGTAGQLGARDGVGPEARFFSPWGVAVDRQGNILVADTNNQLIRKITPAGAVTTVAGSALLTGTANGAGPAARFNGPAGLAFDAAGNLYVSELSNSAIRKVTPEGVVSTFAGVAGVSGAIDGGPGVARFNSPRGLAFDAAGNLYVADWGNSAIRRVAPDGTVSTLSGQLGSPGAVDGAGPAARFDRPMALAVDGAGNVYVGAPRSAGLRRITPAGVVVTIAGQAGPFGESRDGVGLQAGFSGIQALAFDPVGVLYIVDGTKIRRMTPDLRVRTVAGQGGFGFTNGIGTAIQYSGGNGLAVDAAGQIYLADDGNVVIRRAVLEPGSDSLPYFAATAAPFSHTLAPGDTLTLNIPVNGIPPYVFWQRDGAPIPGATAPTLVLRNVGTDAAGTYRFVAGDVDGIMASAPATIAVDGTAARGRLVNLAIRSGIRSGGDPLIVGFVVAAPRSTDTRPLLLRGIGPTLGIFGVPNVAADTVFTLFRGTDAIGGNDDWGGGASLRDSFSSVGAFALAPDSRDAAAVNALTPGSYTLQLTARGTGGVALAEVYEIDGNLTSAVGPRMVNVSTRTHVGTGSDVLIAGFVIGGSTSMTVLVRAVGPSLAAFGVGDVLANPQLELRTSTGLLVAANDDWNGDPELTSVAATVGAFPLSASTRRDSALFLTLPPGAYTAQVNGVGNTTGTALIEIYEVP